MSMGATYSPPGPATAAQPAAAAAPVPGTDPTPDVTELAARLRVAIGRLGRQLRQNSIDGLTGSQLSALVSVERAAPVRLCDLAGMEQITPSTLSRIVASLEERGLVRREVDSADRRAARLTLTALGRSRLDAIRTERSLWLGRRLADLSDPRRGAIADAIEALEDLTADTR